MKIGLVQINNEFDGQIYLPLVSGYLKEYLLARSRNAHNFEFAEFIYSRIKINDALNILQECDIVAFSIYVWNEQLSLEIAKRFKLANPNRKIYTIFGGPQVPDAAEEFFKKNPHVDIAVHNEGEETFKELCDAIYENRDYSQIPNISFMRDGNYFKNLNRKRLVDLSIVPSPYLSGTFDQLIRKFGGSRFLVLWETNRGCPFQCTFCDWGSATASKVNQFPIERIKKELEWIAKSKIEFVFVCDANFGILPRDEEIATFAATLKGKYGYPHALSVQNTKNVKERAFGVQKILTDAGLSKGVTLSMQSLNERTLEFIKRDNISLETYHELQNRFRSSGVLTYSDLILGLPGETLESWKYGIETLINNGQHNRIQFNNLSLLPNAEMNTKEQRRLHGFITVKSGIVNVHGKYLDDFNEVMELQELVVGHNSMPPNEWITARIYAWWVALLYFDKLLMYPLIYLSFLVNRPVGNLLTKVINKAMNSSSTTVLGELQTNFIGHARNIQSGEIEYQKNSDWLDIFWPSDEFALIYLVERKSINNFYLEIQNLLFEILDEESQNFQELKIAIKQSIKLSIKLLRLPCDINEKIHLNEFEIEMLNQIKNFLFPATSEKVEVLEKFDSQPISFKNWLREVVWYGHRAGNYVHKVFVTSRAADVDNEKEVSGHLT